MISDLNNIPLPAKAFIEATYHEFNPLERQDHMMKYQIIEFEDKKHQMNTQMSKLKVSIFDLETGLKAFLEESKYNTIVNDIREQVELSLASDLQ